MSQLKNHLELFQYLPQTNCRDCGLPTCLAFAVAVIKGEKSLDACPHLDRSALEGVEIEAGKPSPQEEEQAQALAQLRAKVQDVEFSPDAASRLGAALKEDALNIKCLGRDFFVHGQGMVTSQCHTNTWITVPLLNYVLTSGGREPAGEWVLLKDLPGGADWARLFRQRCEEPLRKVADHYTDLFKDMVEVFGGRREQALDSDVAVVLHPLPKVPVLIAYWEPEEGMDSVLNVMFDRTATDNLSIESIYSLAAGMALMFERVAQTHG
jgi:hypothetical protein